MNGVVKLKSHVLRRDEKGIFGLSMKRTMLSFGSALMLFSVVKTSLGDMLAAFLGFVLLVTFLVMTSESGGIPRYQHLIYSLRGSLILAAGHGSMPAVEACKMLQLDFKGLTVLDSALIFKVAQISDGNATALGGWGIDLTADNDQQGLRFVDAPFVRN